MNGLVLSRPLSVLHPGQNDRGGEPDFRRGSEMGRKVAGWLPGALISSLEHMHSPATITHTHCKSQQLMHFNCFTVINIICLFFMLIPSYFKILLMKNLINRKIFKPLLLNVPASWKDSGTSVSSDKKMHPTSQAATFHLCSRFTCGQADQQTMCNQWQIIPLKTINSK